MHHLLLYEMELHVLGLNDLYVNKCGNPGALPVLTARLSSRSSDRETGCTDGIGSVYTLEALKPRQRRAQRFRIRGAHPFQVEEVLLALSDDIHARPLRYARVVGLHLRPIFVVT